ncbi:MAG TPA: tetratricopeptide repeat protein [Ideonella sp.]|nr:tetratricopeptide repeat protein [Ideonella sp.]
MTTIHPCSRCGTVVATAIVAALSGCTTPATEGWRIAPNYRVSHAGPGADQGYVALARRYEGERRWREARDAWRKAALAAPRDAETLNALGMAEAAQGQYGDAVEALRRAVKLSPGRASLLNNLGHALLLDGRGDEARATLQDALACDAGHRLARANLERIDRASALALAPAPASAPAPHAAVSLDGEMAIAAPPSPDGPALVAGAAAEVRVEIANGNGVPGMAARLNGWLRARGMAQPALLSNARPYDTATTVVLYRAGFAAAAQDLARHMPQHVDIVFGPEAVLRADLRVLLGRDMQYPGGPQTAAVQ